MCDLLLVLLLGWRWRRGGGGRLGGKLQLPGGFFKATRTKTLKVNRGKTVTETFRTDAGTAPVYIKWFSRGGELKYSITFVADGETAAQEVVPLRKAADRTVILVRTRRAERFCPHGSVLTCTPGPAARSPRAGPPRAVGQRQLHRHPVQCRWVDATCRVLSIRRGGRA